MTLDSLIKVNIIFAKNIHDLRLTVFVFEIKLLLIKRIYVSKVLKIFHFIKYQISLDLYVNFNKIIV